MKRFYLTVFFTFYTIFLPFVTTNCAKQDLAYAPIADASQNDTDEQVLSDCQSSEFLTADCVDPIIQEDDRVQTEQGQVLEGFDALLDFENCKTEVVIAGDASNLSISSFQVTDDEEDTTTDDTDETDDTDNSEEESICPGVIESVVAAYQICDDLDVQDKYDECFRVERIVDEALFQCEAESEEVTEDFCNSLTA